MRALNCCKAMCFACSRPWEHSFTLLFLQDRYIVQALGELERGAVAVSCLHPYAALLFCDLRNAFG
eukprot:5557220-Amphidinium_carterae.1